MDNFNDFSGRDPFNPSNLEASSLVKQFTTRVTFHISAEIWMAALQCTSMKSIQLWSNNTSPTSNRSPEENIFCKCMDSLARWPQRLIITSVFCQKPLECHCLTSSWWHQISHYSLLTLFCETGWQFTWAQLCIAITYKPFRLIQVSKDFRSGRIAHMKGNFVRGAPWIMQWQSGFAGLAEINLIPNKETRWNWQFYPAEKEGK